MARQAIRVVGPGLGRPGGWGAMASVAWGRLSDEGPEWR